ncbi:MAG: MFS transporter [Chloroflexota bacterium]|nr:MFS transporter [Chloroflexota bacterium]
MAAPTSPLTRRERQLVLGVVALALMMVVSAVSGLNVALPDLARDTGATQSELQWIVDAYAIVFAGLLLPAGALGDRYGRKGVLLIGLLVFGAAAATGIFVADPAALIVLRALMGVGAAFVMPVTLSVITTSFPEEERGRAVGVWGGVAGGGAVLGLFGSALLLEWFVWNSFFVLNVSLAILALLGALRFVPNSRDAEAPRLDPIGALLSMGGLVALIYATIEGPDLGWLDPVTLMTFTAALVLLVAFVLWELRRDQPMLDPRLFRHRGFGTGSLSLTVQFFAAFGFFFIVMQYLQFVVGFSPLEAAAVMLPLPAVLIPLARQTPIFAARFGINRVGALGLTLIAAGLLILSFLTADFSFWLFASGVVVFAAGMALAGTPATTAIVSSLPATKQGVASAVNDTSRELGGALGIAVLGSILNDRYRAGMAPILNGLPEGVAARAEASIAFVQGGAAHLGPDGARLVTAAEEAFVDGTTTAVLLAAGVLLLSALYVALRAPRREVVGSIADDPTASSNGHQPVAPLATFERANIDHRPTR